MLPAGCEHITLGLGWSCEDKVDLEASVLVMRDGGEGLQVTDVIGPNRKQQLAVAAHLVQTASQPAAIQHMGDNEESVLALVLVPVLIFVHRQP